MSNPKPTKPCDRCGKPRYWRAKTGLCGECSRSDPGVAARKSAALKARYAADPEMVERHRRGLIERNRTDKMRALSGQQAKTLRIWEKAYAGRTPEGNARMARMQTERKLAHIPPEVRDDYRELRKAKVSVAEATASVLALHEERMAAFRRKLEESL